MSRRSEDQAQMVALAGLLGLRRAADEAALQRLAERSQALRSALAALTVAPAPEDEGPLSAAARAGARQRWEVWADRQRVALTADLARLRAEQIRTAEALRHSLGREEAAKELAAALVRRR
jgi:lactam utilization protein B